MLSERWNQSGNFTARCFATAIAGRDGESNACVGCLYARGEWKWMPALFYLYSRRAATACTCCGSAITRCRHSSCDDDGRQSPNGTCNCQRCWDFRQQRQCGFGQRWAGGIFWSRSKTIVTASAGGGTRTAIRQVTLGTCGTTGGVGCRNDGGWHQWRTVSERGRCGICNGEWDGGCQRGRWHCDFGWQHFLYRTRRLVW